MKAFPKGIPEFNVFKKLNTPAKVQDFVNSFPFNFEKKGETNSSPLISLRRGSMHCFEGALLAAAIFWYHGEKPLLLDLESASDDDSHVVALFGKHGRWGAVSKTNHAVLRYREPVYASVRELAMSYFHEYFKNDTGKKTLRSYAGPFDLSRFGTEWLTSEKDTWHIVDALNASKHYKILPKGILLRHADTIERKAGKIIEWRK
jgi:hypothetical protein